jgi:Fe-S-cluster-containing hydrogenase component 2
VPQAAPAAKKSSSKAATCDLCTELSTPSCVYACPHDAARRVDPSEYFTRQISQDAAAWSSAKSVDRRTTHVTETEHRKNK